MEWKEVRLGDVCSIQRGASPRPIQKFISKEGMPWVKIADATGISSRYISSTSEYIIKEGISKSRIVHPGDLIVSNSATPGLPKFMAIEACVHDGWLIIRDLDGIDKVFLYYVFINIRRRLSNQANGSVFMNLKTDIVKDFVIKLPTLDDQRRIASILSSLDRKIELNNKINADLEEMAQAIFKNWFVDFEPFKDGKFVDSELGMIPEGWKVGTLGELCNFKRGKNLLTKNAIDEGVPVVAGGLEPSCYHNIANTGAPVITVSGSGANAGFMRMYHVPVWASDCSFIDISCKNFYFVYCFLKVNSKLLKHAQTGAVQPHVKPSDIHDFELVIPDKESIYDFQDKVKPFFDKIAVIQKENSRLSLLRDTLLPRLMSGELEVPE